MASNGIVCLLEGVDILTREAQQRRIPGADIDTIKSADGKAPTVTYKSRPQSYIPQGDGTFVDNTGRVVRGPGSVPQLPSGPPGSTPPPSANTLPSFADKSNLILAPDASGDLAWQYAPKSGATVEKEGLMEKKANIDIKKSGINKVQEEATQALSDFDFVNEIVGSYKFKTDPQTGEEYTVDQKGERYTGAPGQIRAGKGLYQFLNPSVFRIPITNSDGSLIGDIRGALTNKWAGFRQSIRKADKGNPQNILLGRYDAFVNERVPGYLKAALVTRTTQTEIDLLKQAFPDPTSMPLPMAIEMAEQLKGVMQSRAETAALRLKEAKEGKVLTPYPDITVHTSQGDVVVPGGNPAIKANELKDIDSFTDGNTEEKPTATQPQETDDDIVMPGGE